jgi:DNA polymerase-3 subunit chi
MTRVDFHTGVADKLGHTCRLLRKAWRAGNSVVVAGSPEQLSRLDSLLWTFEPGEFIPHARLRAGATIAPPLARTPIWLVDVPADAGERDLLVNLGPEMAAGFERYPRVIEIVAEPPDEVSSGRQRWRRYLAAGLAPTNVSTGPAQGAA